MSKVLISVLGPDRKGIIATVARAIADFGGNIESVSQTLLQDIFGALLIVTVPADQNLDSLRRDLQQRCTPLGLILNIDPYTRSAPAAEIEPVQPYVVTVNGPDRNGLVADVADCLSLHGLNITNLQASFTGGSKRFDNVMIFETDVPKSTVMDELRADLNSIATDSGLEISIQHRRIFEAVSHIDR